jgi:branched-chain amino acid transport system permease protein
MMQQSHTQQWVVGGIVLAVLLLFPLVIHNTFFQHIVILFFMFSVMAVAWNIMGGYAGMFSFGQVAFFGIGAYTSSFLLITYQVNPWIGMILGGLVAALVGAAIGYPCSNLRGHYFAIASIAFGEIVRTHFNNWKLIGAAEGLSLPMNQEGLLSFMFNTSKIPYYYIIFIFLLIAVAVCYFISISKIGYYLRAIKESHEVAKVLGINVVGYRLIAIMVSAFLTAMAGTFYAQYVLYIDPESVMPLPISVQLVLISMLGGAGSVMGPVIGAAILIPLAEITRVWLGYKGTGMDMLIYGFLITLISVYQPKGVWGLVSNWTSRAK